MTELELAMRKLANEVKLDTIEACAKLVEQWSASPDRASIAADIRAMSPSPQGTSPCPGCDGHECDDGCQYPGVANSSQLQGGK